MWQGLSEPLAGEGRGPLALNGGVQSQAGQESRQREVSRKAAIGTVNERRAPARHTPAVASETFSMPRLTVRRRHGHRRRERRCPVPENMSPWQCPSRQTAT